MPEEDLETNEGADSFRLQIQGKWTDKGPKKAAVSAFSPNVVVVFFFPLFTSLVSNGIKWSRCPRRSRRYWGEKRHWAGGQDSTQHTQRL